MIDRRDLPLWFMLAADHAAGAGLAGAGRLTKYRNAVFGALGLTAGGFLIQTRLMGLLPNR